MDDLGDKANAKHGAGAGAAVLFLLFALMRLTNTTPDPDLFGYLAFGRLFWETGAFPYHDVFSYVPTLKPWVYHEWLTGVLLYPLYQTLGAPGLQFLKYALGLATLAFMGLTARKQGADFWGIVLSLLLVQGFLASGYSPVRAQVFTYAFFALTLYLLESARLTGRRAWLILLIPLQVLWCNLHGGFLAGLGLVFMYAMGEALSRRPALPFFAALALAALATLVNPYGLDYWRYLHMAVALPRPEITEWVSLLQAWRTGAPLGDFVYFLMVMAVVAFLAVRLKWRDPTPILALALTAWLGLKHQRHQVFFLILAGSYLPALWWAYKIKFEIDFQLSPRLHRLARSGSLLMGVVVGGLLVWNILSSNPLSLKTSSRPELKGRSAIFYPAGALEFIQRHNLAASLLTDFNWGEYLLWHLYPLCRVALDGRFETVYPPSVCQAYFDFIYARKNWRQFLEKYPPDMILIDSRSGIYRLLKEESDWRQVYLDSGCALFITTSEHQID